MNNVLIRTSMFQHNLRMFELARILDVSETTLYRKLREELPEAEQNRIVQLIEQSGGDENDHK